MKCNNCITNYLLTRDNQGWVMSSTPYVSKVGFVDNTGEFLDDVEYVLDGYCEIKQTDLRLYNVPDSEYEKFKERRKKEMQVSVKRCSAQGQKWISNMKLKYNN